MSLIAPLFLLLGLLALPIIIMYMLRLRRREVVVSSTLLWQKLVRDREANAPWQKLKRNLLLILQLIILTLLVFALARPFIPVPSVVNTSVVVLLDGSPSMQASDVAPSRFGAAQEEVGRLINALSAGNQMTLIQVGAVPEVLAAATGNKGLLREALASAQPGNAPADWSAAFALASGAAQGYRDARVIIVSDGGLPQDLPPLPAEVVFVPVGLSAENLAISALATRNADEGVQLFASVTNTGQLPQSALLSLTIDGSLFDAREIDIPAGSTRSLTWLLSPDTAVIEATLSNPTEDNLALDNRALAVHEGAVSNRVLLVTDENIFLEQIFSVLPGLETFKTTPENLALDPDNPFDLYVFDGVAVPEPPPAADMLLVNPPAIPGLDIAVAGVVSDTQRTAAIRVDDSTLLQFVDWSGVNIRQITQIEAPWAQTLVGAEGGPLVLIGEQNSHRVAMLSFDLHDSDLPLQISFPILMANLTNWLNPGRAFETDGALQPGDVVPIVPAASTTAVEIQLPDERVWRSDVGEETLLFTETQQLGLYQVRLIDANGAQEAGSFAINLFDAQESALLPQETLTLGAVPVQTGAGEDIGQLEFWTWLAGIAIVVLIIEWWVFHRGSRLPKLPRTLDVEPLLQRLRRGTK